MKNWIMYGLTTLSIVLLLLLSYSAMQLMDAKDDIKAKQSKIDFLEKQNQILYDDTWHLNQELMKQQAEQ